MWLQTDTESRWIDETWSTTRKPQLLRYCWRYAGSPARAYFVV